MKNWGTFELSDLEKQKVLASINRHSERAPSGCLLWTASTRKDGYGQLGFSGKNWAAHRAHYAAVVGPIPENMCLLHACDNHRCIELSHLSVGTKAENTADMVRKGRAGGAKGERHYKAKLRESDVLWLRAQGIDSREWFKEQALRLGLDESSIRLAVRRKTWRHIP